MSVYNNTFMDNAMNPLDLITGIGNALGVEGQFLIGNLFLLSFFLVMLVFIFKGDFRVALLTSSFLTSVLAILFYIAGMVAAPVIAMPVVLFMITLVFSYAFK